MLPLELKQENLQLPNTDSHDIVLITGSGLRHKRFALRIQNEFGRLVKAWYELDKNTTPKYPNSELTINNENEKKYGKIISKKILYRMAVPYLDGRELLKYLNKIQFNKKET